MRLTYETLKNLKIDVDLGLDPVLDVKQELSEATVADLNLGEIRAVFPLFHAATLDKVTKNYTCYSTESAKSKSLMYGEETGYRSFVKYPKPILDSHDQSYGMPYGRVIWSGVQPLSNATQDVRKDTGSLVTGSNFLAIVAAITDEVGITRVLNGTFNTVSIGLTAHKLICSITGQDILEMVAKGDYPEYFKGQQYKVNNKWVRNYWTASSWTARELSFVNVPADYNATTLIRDVGADKAKLLLSEKVIGKNEFKFYDFFTKEEVDLTHCLQEGDYATDKTWSFEDSYVPKNNKTFSIGGFGEMVESTNNLIPKAGKNKPSLESIIENIVNERKLN